MERCPSMQRQKDMNTMCTVLSFTLLVSSSNEFSKEIPKLNRGKTNKKPGKWKFTMLTAECNLTLNHHLKMYKP